MTCSVSWHLGSTLEQTTVKHSEVLSGVRTIVAACTPCHAESPSWPDQPPDQAVVEWGDRRINIEPVVLAWDEHRLQHPRADRQDQRLVVAHKVVGGSPPDIASGDPITIRVDKERRGNLSRAHTASHLFALALNEVTGAMWRKAPPRLDSRSNPDFDSLCIAESKIDEHGSLETYRLGKSIRKKGLQTQELTDGWVGVVDRAAALCRDFIRTGAEVSVAPSQPCEYSERRSWLAGAPIDAVVPCGGSHVQRTSDVGSITATAKSEGSTLSVRLTS